MRVAWNPQLLGILVFAGLLVAAGLWIVFRRRITPQERERRRRMAVSLNRRSVEGFITEASTEIIHYQYESHGVTYFASQDVTTLQEQLPPEPSRLIGPVDVRFDPRNPANSIIICESWSGLPCMPAPVPEHSQQEGQACS